MISRPQFVELPDYLEMVFGIDHRHLSQVRQGLGNPTCVARDHYYGVAKVEARSCSAEDLMRVECAQGTTIVVVVIVGKIEDREFGGQGRNRADRFGPG